MSNITINEGNQTLIANQTFQFTATCQPTSNPEINWLSSNPAVASVDQTGTVTALTEGIAIISVSVLTNPFIQSSVQVSVQAISAKTITLTPETSHLLINTTLQLTAHVTPQSKKVTFSSNNPEAATVTQSGLVTGLNPGLAIIDALIDNVRANAYIYVRTIPVESFTLNETAVYLNLTNQFQLLASTDKPLIWFSSNTQIATVDNGLVTATGFGSTTITARAEDKSASANVFVNPTETQDSYTFTNSTNVPVVSISLSETSVTMNVGQTHQFIATENPDNASNLTVFWSTSHPNLIAINSDGVVTALAPGTALITGTLDSVTAQAFVTII